MMHVCIGQIMGQMCYIGHSSTCTCDCDPIGVVLPVGGGDSDLLRSTRPYVHAYVKPPLFTARAKLTRRMRTMIVR
jgi:hypothetical protein